MRGQGIKQRVAELAAASLVAAVVLGSIGLAPASAALPPAQNTTAFCVNTPQGFGGFTDIGSTIHRRPIECMAFATIAAGKSAGRFAPGDPVTRGQMASFIARAIDVVNVLEKVDAPSLPSSPPDRFGDDEDDVHEANINRLAAANIVSGTSASSFQPGIPVTRAQMATFINNAQRFLSGGSVVFTSGEDYFVDDNTSPHQANINGIASVGITQGVDRVRYAPSAFVERGNMATFIARYLAVLHAAGAIEELGETPGPATMSITPTTGQRVTAVAEPSTADDRTYTATDLPTGTFRVTLVQASLVTRPNGTYTFTEEGTTNLADAGTVGGQIVAINGQPVTPAQSVGAITPVDGDITFTVDAVDYSRLVPVIYTDQGGANTRLNLDANNRPTEPFAVGGEMETIPVRAGVGPLGADQTVVFVDEAANLIVAGTGSAQRSYVYDSGDNFYRGSLVPANKVTMAQFEAPLSAGDRLDATTIYQPTAATASDFVLENVSPPPPTAHLESPVGESTAVITIDDLISGATAKVYLAADGKSFAESTFKTSSTTDADATKTGFQVNVTGLTPGTSYEFYVTQTVAGEESEPKTSVAGPTTSLVTGKPGAPTITSVTGRPSFFLEFTFSEAVTPRAGAASKFTVVCGLIVSQLETFSAMGTSVAIVDADTLKIGFDKYVPAPDMGVTACTARVAAGAVQDGTSTANLDDEESVS